jgi:hypothetical protein
MFHKREQSIHVQLLFLCLIRKGIDVGLAGEEYCHHSAPSVLTGARMTIRLPSGSSDMTSIELGLMANTNDHRRDSRFEHGLETRGQGLADLLTTRHSSLLGLALSNG